MNRRDGARVARTAVLATLLTSLSMTFAAAQQSDPGASGAEAASDGSPRTDVVDGSDPHSDGVAAELRGRVVLTDPTRRIELGPKPMKVTTDDGRRETVARVTLFDTRGGEALQTVHTALDGSFVFGGLEPLRRYLLRAERPRFQDTELEVTTGVEGATPVALRMPARKTIGWYFRAGGSLMYVLLLISILCLYVAIERSWVLLVRNRGRAGDLVARVRAALAKPDLDSAQQVVDAAEGPVARVLGAGLRQWGGGRKSVERAMENAAIEQIASLERGLAVLSSASGIAPVIGFLGTVVGMIMAFDSIAEHGRIDPSYVADGISTALITTAGGLTVAVFALPVYHVLNTRISAYARQMETAANLLLESAPSDDE